LALGERADDGEVDVDPLERVGRLAQLVLRRRLLLRCDAVHELDVGHDERRQGLGDVGRRHGLEDVGDGGREVEQVLAVELGREGLDEGVELREEGDEVLGAVLAQVLHRLRRRGEHLGVRLVEAGRDVRQLELDVLRVLLRPVRVPADDEDGGVADARVRRELGQHLHDARHEVVVAHVDLGAHRPHREQGRLDVLPLDRVAGGDRARDDVVRLLQARARAEHLAAVLERVADLVPEVAERVAVLAAELARLVRVVQVPDDDPDEVGEDADEGLERRARADLEDALGEAVPEVERDADHLELLVRGALLDELDEREERRRVLDDEGLVPLAGLDEDPAVAAHLVLVLERRRVGEVGPERRQPRDDLLDDGDVLLELHRLVDDVDEDVDSRVEQLVVRQGRKGGGEDRCAGERRRPDLAGPQPRAERLVALVLELRRDSCGRRRASASSA